MREPILPAQRSEYQRPNQNWVCTLAEAEGCGCPWGPDARGRCPQTVACHPIKEGDRWRCNRPELRGGTCEQGPSPEGVCCQSYGCTPKRSQRARRGRFVRGCFMATAGALCLVFSSPSRNEFLAPGELTIHHAQLVSRPDKKTGRCANCHAAGNQPAWQWLAHATDSTRAEPTQSTLCLECHKREIDTDSAPWAHNLEPAQLMEMHSDQDAASAVSRLVDPTQSLTCSTCHREHQGTNHDLTQVSNAACQACHRAQYASFSQGHPDFVTWPERRRTRIAFDHHSHEAKHFPEEKRVFTCAACHQSDSRGTFQRTLSYEEACASCHDSKIETSWESGIPLVALPMVDRDALTDAGHDIGPWPDQAVGDFDGPLPIVAKMLLLSDERGVAALAALGPDFDFYDINPDDPEQLKYAADALRATRQLVADFQRRGQAVLQQRLNSILGRELTKAQFSACTAHLSAADLTGMDAAWFRQAANQDGTIYDRVDSQDLLTVGGWYRDDVTLSLCYKPQGHSDVWLPTWIDLLAEATAGKHQKIAASLLTEAMKPTAPGLCGSCHSIDRDAGGAMVVNWLSKPSTPAQPQFTVFDHAPHVLQAELSDCKTCHRLNPDAAVMESYQSQDPTAYAAGFHAINKQDCTQCHVTGAAGDGCTQCHRYHVGDIR